MDEISEQKLPSVCRLCLNDKAKYLIPFTDDKYPYLAERIQKMTDINIFEHPNLPQKLCNICLQKLNDFFGFKTMCAYSEKLLNEKFPHLLEDIKLKHEFLQVLIIESQLDSETKNPSSEPLKIKNEIFDDFDEFDHQINSPMTIETDLASIAEDARLTLEGITTRKKPKEMRDSSGKLLFPCHICGKTYSKSLLETHLNAHNNIRPFVCDFENCAKTFTSQQSLSTHKHSHSTFNLQCDICKKHYNSHRAIREHMKFHRVPNIQCTQCDMKFKTNKCLKKHMFRHTGERNFPCKSCTKAFATAYNLKIHNRIHTGEKPFTCEHCGISFAYNSLMKAHNEKYHPEVINKQLLV